MYVSGIDGSLRSDILSLPKDILGCHKQEEFGTRRNIDLSNDHSREMCPNSCSHAFVMNREKLLELCAAVFH